MEASPIKLAVIGVMLAIGIITLAFAFDSGSVEVPTTVEVVTSPSPGGETPSKAPKGGSGETVGVHLGIYNGTTESGLAATVGRTLEREGYVLDELGNTVDVQKRTVVYFTKPSDQAAAEQLAQTQFPGAPVVAKPSDLQVVVNGKETSPARSVQVLVFVGGDYAG